MTTAVKPPQLRATVTRAKILANAARLFDKHGYAATSLSDICTAPITKGSVYYHFSSKEDIAAALVDGWIVSASYVHTAVTVDPDLDDAAVVEALVPRLATIADQSVILRAGLRLTLDPQCTAADGYRRWTTLVEQAVDVAIDNGHFIDCPASRAAGPALCAVLIGHLLAPPQGETFPERVAQTTRTLLRTLRPAPTPQEPSA